MALHNVVGIDWPELGSQLNFYNHRQTSLPPQLVQPSLSNWSNSLFLAYNAGPLAPVLIFSTSMLTKYMLINLFSDKMKLMLENETFSQLVSVRVVHYDRQIDVKIQPNTISLLLLLERDKWWQNDSSAALQTFCWEDTPLSTSFIPSSFTFTYSHNARAYRGSSPINIKWLLLTWSGRMFCCFSLCRFPLSDGQVKTDTRKEKMILIWHW